MKNKLVSLRNRANSLRYAAISAVALALPLAARADQADPSELVTTATTAFEAVTTLVVAMVGFYIVVRIVKGIRR